MNPSIRVGIEGGRRKVIDRARQLGAAILVSANSLWRNGRFGGWRAYSGLDVALDSGGFVAMKRYGGYRFSPEAYVELASKMKPTWWAQMDFCCEPEIASDRSTVWKRIDLTAKYLNECQRLATTSNVAMPLIVLQGWKPGDYCIGPIYEQDYQWPDLVGVGSVCRRHIHGPDGLLAVLGALDAVLPPHVGLHFFGVKGTALRYLKDHPRFRSMDSMAWNMAARINAFRSGLECNGDIRAQFMGAWYQTQLKRSIPGSQLSLQMN